MTTHPFINPTNDTWPSCSAVTSFSNQLFFNKAQKYVNSNIFIDIFLIIDIILIITNSYIWYT